MDRALHSDLAKRVVMNTAEGKTELQHMGEQDLVHAVCIAFVPPLQ